MPLQLGKGIWRAINPFGVEALGKSNLLWGKVFASFYGSPGWGGVAAALELVILRTVALGAAF